MKVTDLALLAICILIAPHLSDKQATAVATVILILEVLILIGANA
jgi:hypothetical protein